jgi:4-aminobutyrate aminotransferase
LDMMKKWIPGSHGGTYGGNAVAAAAATATVQAIREDKMLDNTLVRGKQLMEGLQDLQAEFPVIGDVRGLGLMIGVEFRNAQRKPDAATVKAVLQACFERKLMLLGCGTWNNTVRFIPPLNVKAGEIEQGLQIFAEALKAVVK